MMLDEKGWGWFLMRWVCCLVGLTICDVYGGDFKCWIPWVQRTWAKPRYLVLESKYIVLIDDWKKLSTNFLYH